MNQKVRIEWDKTNEPYEFSIQHVEQKNIELHLNPLNPNGGNNFHTYFQIYINSINFSISRTHILAGQANPFRCEGLAWPAGIGGPTK